MFFVYSTLPSSASATAAVSMSETRYLLINFPNTSSTVAERNGVIRTNVYYLRRSTRVERRHDKRGGQRRANVSGKVCFLFGERQRIGAVSTIFGFLKRMCGIGRIVGRHESVDSMQTF